MSPTDPPTPPENEKSGETSDASALPADGSGADAPAELTAEQQLEAYEKSLKEDDWGHQPC